MIPDNAKRAWGGKEPVVASGGLEPAAGKHQDMLSQRGAMALAKRLQRYWLAQGYPAARFWAEPIDERFDKVGTYELYRVACNLMNGLPPVYRDAGPPFPAR